MKEWKYLIGSADDFIGAPEWATEAVQSGNETLFSENHKGSQIAGERLRWKSSHADQLLSNEDANEYPHFFKIIAQRTESFGNAIDLEFCKANPDHPDCKCKEIKVTITNQQAESMQRAIDEFSRNSRIPRSRLEGQVPSKYNRPCKGVTIDVYDVLQAFSVTNPATQHAVKKLLCAGLRGHKDKMQDLTEALKSIERAIELEKE